MKRLVAYLGLALLVAPLATHAANERVTFVPSVDYKSFLMREAVKTSDRRERVINILTDLLKLYSDNEEKAQLRFRLAQLYLDKARHLYFLELYKSDPDADKILRGEVSAPRANLAKLKLEDSYTYNRKAIEIYRDIIGRFPNLKNRDEVLFYMAYNMGEIGKNREAQGYYNELIRRYPQSRFVPEAYLVQAEYLFYDDKFQQALAVYERVLTFKNSPIRDLATYKIAWCYFNLNNSAKAMRTMEKLTEARQKTTSELDLRQEAIRDLVVIFSYGGYHKEAPFYFKQIGGEEFYRPMLKQLAGLYFAQGKNSLAQDSYKRLLGEDPGDKENPEFQKRLVEIAKRLGKKEDVVVEAGKLVRFYSDESKWTEKNRNDWAALQAAKDLSETTLREIALSMHNEAQKTKDDRTYSLAMAAYREYLDNFPDTKDANKIRFYYAESLYKLDKHEQAGIEYTKVVTKEPNGPFGLQAAYGAIVSYDEVLKAQGGASDLKPGKKPTLIPIWERETVRVADNFVKYFPQDRRAAQIAFKAAKVFYDHNHFKEAIKRFDQVIVDYPGAGTTPYAVNLVLDSWNIQEKWQEVVDAGKKYYANPAVPTGKFKQELYGLIEKASFKVCRAKEESGKYPEAAASYLSFVEEFKTSEFVDDALNNASVSFRKGKELDRAVEIAKRLIKEQPNSPFVQNAMVAVGRGLEDLADFSEAASYYELYQQRYPSSKNAADLIYNAGIFRENLGQVDKAIVDYRIYVSQYRGEKDVPVTEFAIALLLEKQKKWAEAANAYSQLANRYRGESDFRITALGRWAQAIEKGGDLNRSLAFYRQTLAAYQQHRAAKGAPLAVESLELVGRAHSKIAEATFVEYANVKLNVSIQAFTGNLQRKIQLLDRLVQEYQKIVSYNSGPWVAQSIYRMALAYDDFAVNLSKVQAPAGLPDNDRKAFLAQIGEIGKNMKSKAVEAYTACIERAGEHDVFDPIVAKAEKRLADLAAKPKTEVKEFTHEPIYINDSIGKGELL